MKVLVTTGIYPPEIGGPATYARAFARASSDEGHAVAVVTYGDCTVSQVEDGVRVRRVARGRSRVWRWLRFAWAVYQEASQVDAVYAQGAVSEGLPTMLAAWVRQRPVVVRVPGDYAWEMAEQRGSSESLDDFLKTRHTGYIGLLERIERWVARCATRVIVPSRYLAHVVEQWGVAHERIAVILNAHEPLPVVGSREQCRKELSCGHDVICVTAVRAVPWKGVAELVAWWKDMPPSHRLVVLGDGPELETWKKCAVEAGVAERVHFYGRVDRHTLAMWFTASDAFLLHSGYEGYPHAAAEAASLGVPCFVSDRGGNPETREVFGELITVLPYRDRDAWVTALRALQVRQGAGDTQVRWTGEMMRTEVWGVMKDAIGISENAPLQVVMIGFERELLRTGSDAAERMRTVAENNVRVRALVLSKMEQDQKADYGEVLAWGFGGSGVRRLWHAWREAVRICRRWPGATVISAQDPFIAGWLGYLVSRWTNCPLEIQEHGDFFSGWWERERWRHRVWARCGRWLLRRAERVRVVSERVREHVMAFGVAADRVDVIPVAQDLQALLSLAVREERIGPMRIVVPCRFVPQKGLDTFLEALSRVRDRGVACDVSLIGEGPLQLWLEEEVRRRGLRERVSFWPWMDRKELWTQADLFVLSSRYEGWGRTVVEAMAAGVPVVATNVGCVGSFLRPDVDGLVVAPDDADGLAAAIQRQIEQRVDCRVLRDQARVRAAEFPAAPALHERQRQGWRSLLRRMRGGSDAPRWDLWVGSFLGAAVLSRLASALLFHHGLAARERDIYHLVESWFMGYGYSFAHQLGCASAFRSPGYLFFLTALYTFISPTNTLVQALVQNAFVVGVLWLVYAVGKRLVGKRAALVGGWLMLLYPYTFYHYTQYYHTFLSSFFLLLLVWFLLRFIDTKKLGYTFGAGVSIACFAYVQGTILPATPLLAAWVLWMLWPEWKRALAGIACMAIVSAGMIAPWTYRNWRTFHRFIPLTTDLGFALFEANNENAYALAKRGYPQEVVDVYETSSTDPGYVKIFMQAPIAEELQRAGEYRESFYWTDWHAKAPIDYVEKCSELGPLDEGVYNAYWKDYTLQWIRQNFWPYEVKLALLKVKTFWQPALFPSVKMGAAWTFAESPTKVWLARTSLTVAASLVIFGGWFGLLWALVRRNRRAVLPLVFLVTYTFLHAFFAGYTKYRIPLDNLMALYAGAFLVTLWDRVRGIQTTPGDI